MRKKKLLKFLEKENNPNWFFWFLFFVFSSMIIFSRQDKNLYFRNFKIKKKNLSLKKNTFNFQQINIFHIFLFLIS